MDDKFEKIESKIDRLDERLDNIDKTLVRQEENLRQHMYRTELLEDSVQMLRDEFKPVQKHVAMLEGALKLIGILGVIAAIISAVLRIVQ